MEPVINIRSQTVVLSQLLIDDDENSFVITRELLQEIDGREVELEWADEAAAGLELMLSGQHDIYLLDYRLGADDGIDVLRRARAAGCQAPIIILTGHGEISMAVNALRSGAQDFVEKPYDDEDLVRRRSAGSDGKRGVGC